MISLAVEDVSDTHVDTILSPSLAIAAIAINCADWPLAAATAAIPPSSAAMRCSNTSCARPLSTTYTFPMSHAYDGWVPDP